MDFCNIRFVELNRGQFGFSDIPPETGTSRDNPPKEEKPYPPADRPVYSIPPNGEEKESVTTFSKMNFTALFVVGILILVLGGVYFYQSGIVRLPLRNSLSSQANELYGQNALKVETLRTINLLEQMEQNYADNPEQLEKIRELKNDAQGILKSLGD